MEATVIDLLFLLAAAGTFLMVGLSLLVLLLVVAGLSYLLLLLRRQKGRLRW